jgi:mitochondrial fission protein ELM1
LRTWLAGETLAYLLDATQDTLNPLPAFYELAQALIVTADSFSMASEALHAGHGPLLLPVNVVPPKGRLRRGLELLADSGLACIARDAADIATFVHNPPERGEANAIYSELAHTVRARLGM